MLVPCMTILGRSLFALLTPQGKVVHLMADIKSGLFHPIASSLHRIVDHRIQASPFLFSILVPSFYTLASGRAHTVL